MTRINLLPWRAARRRRKQRDFLLLLAGSGLMAALMVLLIHAGINQEIVYQESRNEYLRGEIARLKKAEAEVKELDKVKARLSNRLEVIQDLQASRPDMVKVLDAIPRVLPDNVYLNSLKSDGVQLLIKGIASSNNAISSFMRNLGDSTEFGEPMLTIVENRDINDIPASQFELVVKRKNAPPVEPAKTTSGAK